MKNKIIIGIVVSVAVMGGVLLTGCSKGDSPKDTAIKQAKPVVNENFDTEQEEMQLFMGWDKVMENLDFIKGYVANQDLEALKVKCKELGTVRAIRLIEAIDEILASGNREAGGKLYMDALLNF
jgi:hypothetical protein